MATDEDDLESKRRRDKAAESIGQYLLQGYRMLASHCPECMTVLMKSRDGVEVCVLCSSEPCRQEPASAGQQSARRGVATSEPVVSSSVMEGRLVMSEGTSDDELLYSTEQALIRKLVDTSQAVVTSTSPETSMMYCKLVCALCDAVRSVHQLREDLINKPIHN